MAFARHATGPDKKLLSIGRVLVNERDAMAVDLQPYHSMFHKTVAVHRPLYQTPTGYTLTPGKEAIERISYAALVLQVELLSGGELSHRSASSLRKGEWGLFLENNVTVRCLQEFKEDLQSGLYNLSMEAPDSIFLSEEHIHAIAVATANRRRESPRQPLSASVVQGSPPSLAVSGQRASATRFHGLSYITSRIVAESRRPEKLPPRVQSYRDVQYHRINIRNHPFDLILLFCKQVYFKTDRVMKRVTTLPIHRGRTQTAASHSLNHLARKQI